MTNMKCESRNKLSENNLFNYAAGGVAGWGTYQATRTALRLPYSRYFRDGISQISEAENKALWDAAHDVFTTTNMSSKNISMKDLSKLDAEKFANETVAKTSLKNKPRKKIWYYLFGETKSEKLRKHLKAVGEGNNACYIPWTKTVAINSEKMGFSAFHEMGHSLNHTGKGLGKHLHKSRHLAAAAVPFILAYGLLTNKKEDAPFVDDKIGNFVKKNTGALMFACMIPTLMEEGLASIKGAKLAKPKLSKDLYNKMCKSYAKAWGTYAVGAAAIGLCGAFAVYIRDKIVGNKKTRSI